MVTHIYDITAHIQARLQLLEEAVRQVEYTDQLERLRTDLTERQRALTRDLVALHTKVDELVVQVTNIETRINTWAADYFTNGMPSREQKEAAIRALYGRDSETAEYLINHVHALQVGNTAGSNGNDEK